jgi:hypothetical protein
VEGKVDEAETYIARGTGSNSYSEILGNLNLAKGNFAAAATNLMGVNSNSAALAQILNRDYVAAEATLNNVANADAYTSYLKAILNARRGNASAVISNLQTAIQQNPSLAQRAVRDLEFAKYATQIAGLVK